MTKSLDEAMTIGAHMEQYISLKSSIKFAKENIDLY
jgi:hypothetical protein